MTPEMRAALDLLEEGTSFVLVGHVRPDGDCLGAQAALSQVLTARGKRVEILNPDSPGAGFEHLVGRRPFGVYEGGDVPDHDVCVLLDINVLSRCGALEGPLGEASSKKLVIDHHPFQGQPWWDASFVDVTASATGLLVYRIARAMGYEPDPVFDRAVFTSLVTDTGWFKYSNTDGETMGVAAEIVGRGLVPSELYGQLYQNSKHEQPLAIAAVLDRLEYFGNRRLAVVDQPLELGPDRTLHDSDPVLDIVRAVGDVEVVLYLRELEGGLCKLSARSKSTYDVNALATRFGGGGHVKASGATIRGDLSTVRARLIEAALEGFSSATAPGAGTS